MKGKERKIKKGQEVYSGEKRPSGSSNEIWLLPFRRLDLSEVGKSTAHKVQRVNKCSGSGGNAKVPPLEGKFYTLYTVANEHISGGRS